MRDVLLYAAIGILDALFTKLRWGKHPDAPSRLVLALGVLTWPIGLLLWVLGPILRHTRFAAWALETRRRHHEEAH